MFVKLMQPGLETRSVEVAEGTTVETFLTDQDLAGNVYRNGPVANAQDILAEGDEVLVVPDKSV